jgi:hypothetical protein
MPLSFLVPVFLAGLAALAVPLVVHLRHRERKEPVRFPSLMFLRRIPFREARRQQIHHWPLFLLRLLAVTLLALAFARPFVPEGGATVAGADTDRREVVILLDRSASMGAADRWSRARDSARAVIATLQDGDRAALLLFDAVPEAAAGPTTDRALLGAALDAAIPSTRGTRYAVALRAARDLLAGSERSRRTLVVISDFQRAGWQGEAIEPLPVGTEFRTVDVSAGSSANAGFAGVELREDGRGERPGVLVAVRLAGDSAVVGTTVSLVVDDRPGGSATVASSSGAATLGPVAVGDAPARGLAVRNRGGLLAADDTLRFVANPPRPVRVLLVDRGDGGSAFVERALAISAAPRVAVTTRTAPLRSDDVERADVVVLHDAPVPGGAAGERLREFVTRGGGLVTVAGDALARLPDWTGIRIGPAVDSGASTLGAIRGDHPVFEPFAAPGSGDFGAVRVFRYRSLSGDSAEVLARFADGAPALVTRDVGRGRLLALATSLDNTWNDLPLQPLFLPLVHQLVLYAAQHVERPATHAVGQVATIGLDQLEGNAAVVVVTPSGRRTRRQLTGQPLAVTLDEAGFHEVREARAGGRLLALIAANVDPVEARLEPMDPADLGIAAGAVDSATAAASRAELASDAERERRQGVWWFLLAAVAVALGLETVVGGRIRGYVRAMAPAAGAP